MLAVSIALPVGADEPKDRFTAHTADAILPGVAATALGDGWTLRPGGRLVEMQRDGVARPALPTRDFVLLTHGDHVPFDPARPLRLAEGRLSFTPAEGFSREAWSVYLPYVALVVRQLPADDDLLAKLRHEVRPRDLVVLLNGDRVEGTLVALDAVDGCAVRDGLRTARVPWEKVAAVAMSGERQAKPRLRKAHGHVVLADGGRVVCAALQSDGATTWRGRTWFGAEVQLPVARVVNLSILHGPADYLADLAPTRVEQVPYLGVTWPVARNRSVTGGPLHLGRDLFDRGLGVHAETRVSYTLASKYRRFEAVVGLDASAGRLARATLAVLVDGVRHEIGPKEWSGREGPMAVRLDVRGAKTLTLAAERGGFGDVQAHVAWANARLIAVAED